MFTTTFTLEHHIEELRGTTDTQETCSIKAELEAMLMTRDDLIREADAAP